MIRTIYPLRYFHLNWVIYLFRRNDFTTEKQKNVIFYKFDLILYNLEEFFLKNFKSMWGCIVAKWCTGFSCCMCFNYCGISIFVSDDLSISTGKLQVVHKARNKLSHFDSQMAPNCYENKINKSDKKCDQWRNNLTKLIIVLNWT